MSRQGSYLGGSTVIGPRSGWFSTSTPEPKGTKVKTKKASKAKKRRAKKPSPNLGAAKPADVSAAQAKEARLRRRLMELLGERERTMKAAAHFRKREAEEGRFMANARARVNSKMFAMRAAAEETELRGVEDQIAKLKATLGAAAEEAIAEFDALRALISRPKPAAPPGGKRKKKRKSSAPQFGLP